LNLVRQKSKEVSGLLLDEARLKELRTNRGQTRERLYGTSPTRSSRDHGYGGRGEDADLQKAIELSKQQSHQDESRRLQLREEEELQRAIELSEREALNRQREERDRDYGNDSVQYSLYNFREKQNDIIDFFGSLEPVQQPITNNVFGGFDPFQQQQQQQMYLQEQQQQQLQLQLQQQQQLQQQMYLQQQQQQQMAFSNQFIANPHNPFAAPQPQPQAQTQQQLFDANISSNPKYVMLISAVLDPFARVSNKVTMTGGSVTSAPANPFGAGKQLVDLDQLSTTSSQRQQQQQAAQKNPFSATNSGKYQWEPMTAAPTVGGMQSYGSSVGTNQGMGGSSFGGMSNQFTGLSNQVTGSTVLTGGGGSLTLNQNPFGAQQVQFGAQIGQPQMMGQQDNPFGQQQHVNQNQNSFF
jgi:epsin